MKKAWSTIQKRWQRHKAKYEWALNTARSADPELSQAYSCLSWTHHFRQYGQWRHLCCWCQANHHPCHSLRLLVPYGQKSWRRWEWQWDWYPTPTHTTETRRWLTPKMTSSMHYSCRCWTHARCTRGTKRDKKRKKKAKRVPPLQLSFLVQETNKQTKECTLAHA